MGRKPKFSAETKVYICEQYGNLIYRVVLKI